MITVFSPKCDFIVLTSIDFALAKVGPPIVAYSPTLDFSAVTKLALSGHGSPGKIEGYSAETIGTHLADPVRGVKKGLEKLVVTSCCAGELVNGKAGTSVVDVLAKMLRGHGVGGLEIVGYNGPSIKSAQLGTFVKVVNAPNDTAINNAFALQNKAKSETPVNFSALTAELNDPALIAKAANAASQTTPFYVNFVDKLEKANMLMKGDEVARICVVLD